LYLFRWEDLDDMEYSALVDKIVKAYDIVREDYAKYIESQKKIIAILKEEYGFDIKPMLSGFSIDEKELHFTKGLIKSEKNGKQNEAITKVLNDLKMVDVNNVYIEFGAGKGGLSFFINQLTGDKTTHILLERDGVRFKRDRHSENMHRVIIYNPSLKLIYLTLI
jgi:hypothetical protein